MINHDFLCQSHNFFNVVFKFVGTIQIFQVSPEAFNRVQVRTIRWLPYDHDPMFKQAQGCQSESTLIVRSVIHHQNHSTCRVLLYQQLLKKADERGTVLCYRCRPGDRIFQSVVAAKDMSLLLFTWLGGRNAPLLSNLHPTSSQRRIQCHGRLVHKDELEIVSKDLLFNPSSTSTASGLASLSCK